MNPKILVVEDEPALLDTLEYSLTFLAGGPGRLQLFTPLGDVVLDDELPGAGSMVFDRKLNSVIVASINTGELTVIPIP